MIHLALMCLYAAVVALFFSLLSRRRFDLRLRLFLVIFCGLVLGALALAWLMYPFPPGPPAPIP